MKCAAIILSILMLAMTIIPLTAISESQVTESCCSKMMDKCSKHTAKREGQKSKDDCNGGGCNALMTCARCPYMHVATYRLNDLTILAPIPMVQALDEDNVPGYPTACWHPPNAS